MKEETDEQDTRVKKSDVEIRQMEIDDIATVFHLGEELFKAREVPNLYRTWDDYEVITFFQGDSEFCLVAEVEETIVGFVLGTTVTKSHSAWKYGLMVWLGVHPDFQRYGIATKLFKEFKELMLDNGVRMLLVDTEADNLDALQFFTRVGFGNPEEHLYLSLNLASQLKAYKKKNGNEKNHKN
jgi:ribosomal protein S18 acetylase RimI-like enzyme